MDGFAGATVNKDLSVSHGDDTGLLVRFFKDAVQNDYLSEQAGRPIFDEFDFVEITVPGGKLQVKNKVTAEDKMRFPRHWQAYQDKQNGKTGEVLIGTPLDQWPSCSTKQIHEWRAMGIFTVDQLAALSDQGIQAMGMGAREWKAKAQAYIAKASNDANEQALAAENERMANDMLALQEQVRSLAAQLQNMQNQQASRPQVAMPTPPVIGTFDADVEWASKNQPADPSVVRFVPPENMTENVQIDIPERRRGRPPKTA